MAIYKYLYYKEVLEKSTKKPPSISFQPKLEQTIQKIEFYHTISRLCFQYAVYVSRYRGGNRRNVRGDRPEPL